MISLELKHFRPYFVNYSLIYQFGMEFACSFG